jgi:hypothetical protein
MAPAELTALGFRLDSTVATARSRLADKPVFWAAVAIDCVTDALSEFVGEFREVAAGTEVASISENPVALAGVSQSNNKVSNAQSKYGSITRPPFSLVCRGKMGECKK